MKTVVYDNPWVNPGSVPEIGKQFNNGEERVLSDEDAEIVLRNSHFRLASDTMTPFQKAQAEAEPAKAPTPAPSAAAAPAQAPNSSVPIPVPAAAKPTE
jgi:hypothetical protein